MYLKRGGELLFGYTDKSLFHTHDLGRLYSFIEAESKSYDNNENVTDKVKISNKHFDLSKEVLIDLKFYNTSFVDVRVIDSILKNNRFERCILDVVFTNSLMNDVVFQSTEIEDGSFRSVVMNQSSIRNCTIRNTDFSGITFSKVCLNVSYFHDCNFSNAVFNECSFDHTKFFNCDFTNAKFVGNSPYLNNDSFDTECIRPVFNIVPERGSFTAFKAVKGYNPPFTKFTDEKTFILQVEVGEFAQRVHTVAGRKVRVSELTVVKAFDMDGSEIQNPENWAFYSYHNPYYEYRVGATQEPDEFDSDFGTECSNGLHVFTTYGEALDYAKAIS